MDLPLVAGVPPRLDVTETTIVAQRFAAREGEAQADSGYGAWLNRLNVALRYKRVTIGTRLDSSMYWLRPVDRATCTADGSGGFGCVEATQRNNLAQDDASRFRDAIYPAKLWATYQAPDLTATLGDAYVQFGRGLVLSMRKIDELGVDNTVRGAKVTWSPDPFSFTLVAGEANPNRVDEATGRALFLRRETPGSNGPQPMFGSDRIVGAQIEAGRGLPVVLSTHAARVTRCAPYRYTADGRIDTSYTPIGSCDPGDTRAWMASLPAGGGPAMLASEILTAGQSLQVPDLAGHGNLYLEAAVQRRHRDDEPRAAESGGNAVYGALTTSFGAVTSTLEVKSYRNFYATPGAVDITRGAAFNNVLYSTPPTAEVVTQDSMFGFFNACVDGGRLRTNVRTSKRLLFYVQGGYFYTRSEVTGGGCNAAGRTVTSDPDPANVHNDVIDGLTGFEWRFDEDRSHLFAWGGARDDTTRSGEAFYSEAFLQYDFTKHLGGPYSLELIGRHRLRKQENQNLRGDPINEQPWREGENYTAIKIAPKWAISQGVEYTTRLGLPTMYFNGSLLYRFTSESNLKVLVGQQRGGLKCVSGVCKIFPPFEGARVELTLRF